MAAVKPALLPLLLVVTGIPLSNCQEGNNLL